VANRAAAAVAAGEILRPPTLALTVDRVDSGKRHASGVLFETLDAPTEAQVDIRTGLGMIE